MHPIDPYHAALVNLITEHQAQIRADAVGRTAPAPPRRGVPDRAGDAGRLATLRHRIAQYLPQSASVRCLCFIVGSRRQRVDQRLPRP